jgi:beta-lactamase regulating signal transducer with metallopeptidase domain
MQLLFLSQWVSDEMLKAMCWTLVHSLWQGLLAAAVAGIIIISTKKTSARLRYNLLGLLLVLFLFTVAFTARQQVGDIDFGTTVANGLPQENNSLLIATGQQAQLNVTTTGSAERLIQFMNDHAGFIMLVWVLFFLVNCTKICTGIAGIHRLRTRKIHEAEGWQTKLNYLSRVIGINKPVRLLQSELVRVPVAIGFFKPVILVPLGLLSHLPPDQVETILLHELAHIRRRDYLVNILQRFAEAVFFFNPALLWISSLIRQEREACCDDIVVANTSHKGSYLEALVSFQEYSLSTSAYAMGISSKKHYLLNRVKRMLTRENKKLDLMEKILLLIGVTVVSAFTFMPKNEAVVQQPQQQQPVRQSIKRTDEKTESTELATPSSAIVTNRVLPRRTVPHKEAMKPVLSQAPVKDTVPPKNEQSQTSSSNNEEMSFQSRSTTVVDDGKTRTSTTTLTDKNGKKYSISRLNDKVTNLSVDGKTIPESEFEKYSSLIGQIERAEGQRKVKKDEEMKRRNEEMNKRNEERKTRADEGLQQRKEEMIRKNEERKVKMGEERNKKTEELNKQKSLNDIEFHKKIEKFEKDNERMKKENEKRKEDFEKHRKEIDRKMEEKRKEIDKERERLHKEMEQERKKTQEEMKRERERIQKEIEKDRKEAEKERKEGKKVPDSKDRDSNIFRKGKKAPLFNEREVVVNQNVNGSGDRNSNNDGGNNTQKTIANSKDIVIASSDNKEAIKRRNNVQLFAKTEIHTAVFKKDLLKNNTFRLNSNMQLKPRTLLNLEIKTNTIQYPQPKRLANPRKPVTLVTPAKDAGKSSPAAPGGKDSKMIKYPPRVQKPLLFNVT